MQTRSRGSQRLLAGFAVAALVASAAACSGESGSEANGADLERLEEIRHGTETADWEIRPGVEMVTVYGAEPEQQLTLYDVAGDARTTVEADEQGRAHLAYIPDDPDLTVEEAAQAGLADGHVLRPGRYVLRDDNADPKLASEPFRVLARDDVPDEELYEGQELHGVDMNVLGDPVNGVASDGYQYLEMRDGVTLSAMVRFPDRGLYGDGPWPTVVEYSGYGPSNPDAEEPGTRLARTFGYATVSVNMRGTGCSGGIFDTFNPAQQADGYDIIETVARQPWVLHGHVGMVGLSYSGISQLYTAATQPPHLAAVTSQSVIADPWLQQWPSGMYNGGFTRQWLAERERQSAAGGSPWVQARVNGGDTTCAENVADHELNIDFEAFGRSLVMRPEDSAARDLRELVKDVDAAVFLTGAFEDEQTGPQFGVMLDDFDRARALRVSLWNGRHPDGYSTMNVGQLFEFLELYVAERVPRVPEVLRGAIASEVARSFGFTTGELAPDRLYEEFEDDYDAALAAYEDEDPVRVVFGSGHGTDEPGEPGGIWETRFSTWPTRDAERTTWYLGPDGTLVDERPEDEDEQEFAFDPEAAATTLLSEYETLAAVQRWNWTPFPEGRSLSYETDPLEEDVVVAGSGLLRLWVGLEGADADEPDADVQVTVSEVRPDGVEYLVQNGWLRLGHRAVEGRPGRDLELRRTYREEDYEPMPDDGELTEAWVEIPAMGHVFAEGSRLRITVSSPGRNHVTWTFEPPEGVTAETTYNVGMGGSSSSALQLPVVDIEPEPDPDTPAPCPGLRGMACRPLAPLGG